MKIQTLIILALLGSLPQAWAESRLDEKIDDVIEVIADMKQMPDGNIPPALLRRARAVVIVPNMFKVGVLVGGSRGEGILSVRNATGWTAPVFITLTGGSLGLQAGVERSDLVLVFTNDDSVKNITRGKFTLGADASVATGPVGRHGKAMTDKNFDAAVYSYSRTKGIFAGLSLAGSVLKIDHKANASYYATAGLTAQSILDDRLSVIPAGVPALRSALPNLGQPAAARSPATPATAATPVPASDAPGQVRTYAFGDRPAEAGSDEEQ